MICEKTSDGKKLNVKLIGEVDSLNSAKIEEELLKEAEGVTDLTFDMSELEYISSAGLLMLLHLQRMMQTQGSMRIINTNEEVMEIFRITEFDRLLDFV